MQYAARLVLVVLPQNGQGIIENYFCLSRCADCIKLRN